MDLNEAISLHDRQRSIKTRGSGQSQFAYKFPDRWRHTSIGNPGNCFDNALVDGRKTERSRSRHYIVKYDDISTRLSTCRLATFPLFREIRGVTPPVGSCRRLSASR